MGTLISEKPLAELSMWTPGRYSARGFSDMRVPILFVWLMVCMTGVYPSFGQVEVELSYAALSYCWGPPGTHQVQLDQETEKDLLSGGINSQRFRFPQTILVDIVPRTFCFIFFGRPLVPTQCIYPQVVNSQFSAASDSIEY
jgi:hypothetical protein